MSISIIIISHKNIGESILHATKDAFGKELPIPVYIVDVQPDTDPEKLSPRLEAAISELDQGQGVLILTDLYGSTPSNIAQKISHIDSVRIVTGLNLPMLIKTLNYPKLTLDELAEKARRGGRAGIIICGCGIK